MTRISDCCNFSFISAGGRKLATFCFLMGSANSAAALSMEAAVDRCRVSTGKPAIAACTRSGGEAEACRAKAEPRVRACAQNLLNTRQGEAYAPGVKPSEATPKVQIPTTPATGLVAPPRTIADIAAVLESEKPDSTKLELLRSNADRQLSGRESREEIVRFYLARSNARSELGRTGDAIADAKKAVEAVRGLPAGSLASRAIQNLGVQYEVAGDLRRALEVYQRQHQAVMSRPGGKGAQFYLNRAIAGILVQMGNITQAESYVARNLAAIREVRTGGPPALRAAYAKLGPNWESELDIGRGIVLEARGRFADAEAAYRMGEQRRRAGMQALLEVENPPTKTQLLQQIDSTVFWQARMKARQGRLAEAEVDARRALLGRLNDVGKYNALTPLFVTALAVILVEQGRHDDAEKLARIAVETYEAMGTAPDSQFFVLVQSRLADILALRQRLTEAAVIYDRIDRATTNWETARRQTFELNPMRIFSLYAAGQVDSGIAAASRLVRRQVEMFGDKHFDTALARGTLAIGLMQAGRDMEAVNEFKSAIPIMMSSARENDGDDASFVTARATRLQRIVESYIVLRARDSGSTSSVGEETFLLTDSIRGRSVQQALAASSARAAAKDPALANIVRSEQDLAKQVAAHFGLLNNMLALPSAERDEKAVQGVNASINRLRAERDKVRDKINQNFPAYADLTSPKSTSAEEIRAALADGETMLSFYFGQVGSFVWAVPKTGAVVFAPVKATIAETERKIRKLREALEPQAAMVSDIPPFDLKLAYELYSQLLKPVEEAWMPARSLIVVTNGALGQLPLALLPTRPVEASRDGDLLFSGYRSVPWLARTHAVSTLPSTAALRTLRQLPPGNSSRSELVAFGDPYFSKEQHVEGEEFEARVSAPDENVTRGLPLKRRNASKLTGVDNAELALLPRLSDTAEELKSIALALQVDPTKVLYLGKNAAETVVKTMNLSGFKVIAFATHGLVPGELNGLTQPALALSSPAVTGEQGDGLLTMEEILSLKLDADWVILSACNTGTGEGAGAEAASGLGRAFFYAGTRTLLVTNWAVHSQSARELVTSVFKRQADSAGMSRGEALRQAMMALVDGPGYLLNGKAEFAYAHPLFWAPYTIIGDGGRR